MASGGNTWQKKLVNKQAAHVRRVKGIKQRFAVDLEVDTSVKQPYDDKGRPTFTTATKAEWKPRPFGWRKAMKACQAGRTVWAGSRAGSSGCYLAK